MKTCWARKWHTSVSSWEKPKVDIEYTSLFVSISFLQNHVHFSISSSFVWFDWTHWRLEWLSPFCQDIPIESPLFLSPLCTATLQTMSGPTFAYNGQINITINCSLLSERLIFSPYRFHFHSHFCFCFFTTFIFQLLFVFLFVFLFLFLFLCESQDWMRNLRKLWEEWT